MVRTVHVSVLVHFCDYLSGFFCGSESVMVFYCLCISALPLEVI